MTKDPDLIRQHPAIYDAPEREHTSRRDELMAASRLKPAKIRLAELGTPADAPHDMSISEALKELRSSS